MHHKRERQGLRGPRDATGVVLPKVENKPSRPAPCSDRMNQRLQGCRSADLVNPGSNIRATKLWDSVVSSAAFFPEPPGNRPVCLCSWPGACGEEATGVRMQRGIAVESLSVSGVAIESFSTRNLHI